MRNLVTIQSENYNGKILNIIFFPDNENIRIDLGNHELPYEFDSSLLNPPREIYGQYSINNSLGECVYNLFIARPNF